MTPLELSILLHYYGCADDFRNGDFSAPAVSAAFETFLDPDVGMLELQAVAIELYEARKALRALLDRPVVQPMTEDEINLVFERWWETKPPELVRYPSPEVTMQWTAFVAGWQAHHHIGEKP